MLLVDNNHNSLQNIQLHYAAEIISALYTAAQPMSYYGQLLMWAYLLLGLHLQ